MNPRSVAVLALLAACDAPGPELAARDEALVGGTIDHADPGVVALTFSNGSIFCTGSLISPSVVLTAAHCVDMFGGDPNITVYFGDDASGAGVRIGVRATTYNLGWTGNLANQHDVAMVLLKFPADPSLVLPLNDVSPIAGHVGDPYRHVGFGVFDRANQTVDGHKRTGTTTITGTDGDVVQSGDANVSICFGDSGGPGLLTIAGKEYIGGIHSYTSGSQCDPPNGDTMVDVYADAFILPWVQAHDPTCGADGLCARVGCASDPDCVPCGPDGTCTKGCALPDPDCATSGLGEICQADSQCQSGLCVFWRDDLKSKFCSEPCTIGSTTCPKGMSCQNVTPFGDVCYYDAAPPGVLGDTCEVPTDCGSYRCEAGACTYACDLGAGKLCPDGFECKPSGGADLTCQAIAQPAGCGCRSDGGGAGAALGALGVLALVTRRRRR